MKTVVLVSGGLDSAVLLYHLLKTDGEIWALSFNYGQRHRKELLCAADIAWRLGVAHTIADLRGVRPLLAGSALTSDDIPVPHGHYTDESMKATVVPNRNMIMLAFAAGFAISRGCEAVAYAAHAGDRATYPDCRPEFIVAMRVALKRCHFEGVQLVTPFVDLTKADIVRRGVELGVPFERTWSCYEGGVIPCGRCGTCVERKEAFELAGVPDPTVYA